MQTMKPRGLACLIVLVGVMLIGPVWAEAPWVLFGDAVAVKGAPKPNPWAVELSSECPSGYPTCLGDGSLTFSGVSFQAPVGNLTFADLQQLSASWIVIAGDCGGGSPRFQIGLDTDGDGVRDGNIFVYIGPLPNLTGCPTGWQITGNLIGISDTRYDLTQVGGTFYDTYANALALHGSARVVGIELVVDGGWFTPPLQSFDVDNVTVNEHRLTARGFRP